VTPRRPHDRGAEPLGIPPEAEPVPDVLAWDLEAAVEALAALGRSFRVVPAGAAAARGALRWRVARQTVLPGGELLVVIVPEAPGPAQALAADSGRPEVEGRA